MPCSVPPGYNVALVAMSPAQAEAYDRVVAAAELVVRGAEVGPSDTTPLEQLGEALDALRDLRQYGGG